MDRWGVLTMNSCLICEALWYTFGLLFVLLLIPKLDLHCNWIDISESSQVMTINMIHRLGGEGANYKEDG